MFVHLGATTSTQLTIANGMKQCENMSPILFDVYINDLSMTLNTSGVEGGGGWLLSQEFLLNHLCFAKDLCLISLSSNGMQKLLNICQNYATNHQLLYNGANIISLFTQNNTCIAVLQW